MLDPKDLLLLIKNELETYHGSGTRPDRAFMLTSDGSGQIVLKDPDTGEMECHV